MANSCGLWLAILFLLIVSSPGGAQETKLFFGASPQESQELGGAAVAERAGDKATIEFYNSVINRNPKNRPALLERSRLRLAMGNVEGAKSDLAALKAADPGFIGLVFTEGALYHAVGDAKNELQVMKDAQAKNANSPPDTLQGIEAARATVIVEELNGKLQKVEEALVRAVDSADPVSRPYEMEFLADFYVRNGQFSKAVALYKPAIAGKSDRSQSYRVMAIDYSRLLWANGNRDAAAAMAVENAQDLLDLADKPRTVVPPEHLIWQALAASALTGAGAGSKADKAAAESALADVERMASPNHLYSTNSILLTFSGKIPLKEEVERVEKVLKAAPNLDWALWAAMYLYLSGAEEARDLVKLLPEKSIQKRIVEVEEKAAKDAGRPFPPKFVPPATKQDISGKGAATDKPAAPSPEASKAPVPSATKPAP
jgi:tetratricopeptide (TPR) repeat protein